MIISYSQDGQNKQEKTTQKFIENSCKTWSIIWKSTESWSDNLATYGNAFSFEVHAMETSGVDQSTNGSGNKIFFDIREKTLE